MREDNCARLLKELDLDGGDAKELVWDVKQGNPLGRFVCGLTASGLPVRGWDSGALIAGDPKLKVVMGLGGMQTFTLHKAEAADGQKMLIGYRLADANQEKALSVQDWTVFAASATGGRFVTRDICDPVFARPEDDRSAEGALIPARVRSALPRSP